LIWIIPSEHLNHWITVLVRRNANQAVEMVIADSIGMDRRVMQDIQEIYQSVNLPLTHLQRQHRHRPTTSSQASSTSTQQFNPSTSATPSSHNNAHTNDEQEKMMDVPNVIQYLFDDKRHNTITNKKQYCFQPSS
jgi:hypothetical protein